MPWSFGESRRHHAMKVAVRQLYPNDFLDYEVPLIPGRCADVQLSGRIAVECQASAISAREWRARSEAYTDHGYAVLWIFHLNRLCGVPSFEDITRGQEVRVPAELRVCHRASFGRIYVIDDDDLLLSCHLEAVERFTGEGWYIPKSIKIMRWHGAGAKLMRLHGPEGHLLVNLGEGVWWKR